MQLIINNLLSFNKECCQKTKKKKKELNGNEKKKKNKQIYGGAEMEERV